MKRIPKEKNYTIAQLQKKINVFRKLISLQGHRKETSGSETFFDTPEGKIRVLTYNFEQDETLPLFIDIHGGGFVMGDPEMDDPYMMNIAKQSRIKIISIDYSLSPESAFPKALHECYAVAKYVKEHSEELKINPGKIALGGHSAGGNLCTGICIMDDEKKELGIKALILDYPPMDLYTDAYLKSHPKGSLPAKMCRMFDACYCINKADRKNPLISPIYAELGQLKSFPPTLVLTAGRDSLCRETKLFSDKLTKAKVEVSYNCFENSVHGFTLSTTRDDAKEGWQLMINFLKEHLC